MRLFLDPFFQDFADILYAAKIITKEEIQKVLRVMPNDFVKYFKEQNKGPDLDEWELGYLALKLGSRAIQTLAELNPREGFPQEQVDHADGWHFAFNTLLQWRIRTENSREVQVNFFCNDDMFDPLF